MYITAVGFAIHVLLIQQTKARGAPPASQMQIELSASAGPALTCHPGLSASPSRPARGRRSSPLNTRHIYLNWHQTNSAVMAAASLSSGPVICLTAPQAPRRRATSAAPPRHKRHCRRATAPPHRERRKKAPAVRAVADARREPAADAADADDADDAADAPPARRHRDVGAMTG